MASGVCRGIQALQGYISRVSPLIKNSTGFRVSSSTLSSARRCYSNDSSSNELVTVTKDESTGVATVIMNRKPVNALNLEFFTQLNITFDKLEEDKSVRGMILTSAIPNYFSAGLDIFEMYQPNMDRLREFWRNFQDCWYKIYSSRLITMAAVMGHAPAAGAMLAMATDYRVIAQGKFVIGFNETQLGIVAPFWMMDLLVDRVGKNNADRALQLGEMYSPEQAVQLGMLNDSTEMNNVLPMVQKEMAKWLKLPDVARQLSKMAVRKQTLQTFIAKRDKEFDAIQAYIGKESIQKAIGKYLEGLKKK